MSTKSKLKTLLDNSHSGNNINTMTEGFDESYRTNLFLEYLISQGLKGNHLLFDNHQIRRAFAHNPREIEKLGVEKLREVKEAFQHILQLQDIWEKKEYIAKLPEEIQNIIIQLYFQLLEKNLLSKKPRLH